MKNKKKWIITGIIAGILAVVAVAAVVVIIIVRKPVAIETPIPGVKLGMDSKELKKILDKKGIEYSEHETHISFREIYLELFEEETYMLFIFSDENKLVDMQVTINYSTVEECNEHLEKVKAYYTKKYGKPTTKKGTSVVDYFWKQGNEEIDMFTFSEDETLYITYCNLEYLEKK